MKGHQMKKSKCCNADAKVLHSGEFTTDIVRTWEELECQQCGEIDFEDEVKTSHQN